MINAELVITPVSYSELADGELIDLINSGDVNALDYLIIKYKGLANSKAHTYYLIGSDRDDVVQEGMIGLFKAIRDYDGSKLASFRSFAELCITRQIITSIKTATRQKHTPLNSYISLYKPIYNDDSEQTLLDSIAACSSSDPQELLVNRERLQYVEAQLVKALSKLERHALSLYVQGCTYEEISAELNRHVKSVDNALQRVKKKIEQLLEESELVF